MFAQVIKKQRGWVVPAAIVVALAGIFVARTAFARIVYTYFRRESG